MIDDTNGWNNYQVIKNS